MEAPGPRPLAPRPLPLSSVGEIVKGLQGGLTAALTKTSFAHVNYLTCPSLPPQHNKQSQTGYSLTTEVSLNGSIDKVNPQLEGSRHLVYPV